MFEDTPAIVFAVFFLAGALFLYRLLKALPVVPPVVLPFLGFNISLLLTRLFLSLLAVLSLSICALGLVALLRDFLE